MIFNVGDKVICKNAAGNPDLMPYVDKELIVTKVNENGKDNCWIAFGDMEDTRWGDTLFKLVEKNEIIVPKNNNIKTSGWGF